MAPLQQALQLVRQCLLELDATYCGGTRSRVRLFVNQLSTLNRQIDPAVFSDIYSHLQCDVIADADEVVEIQTHLVSTFFTINGLHVDKLIAGEIKRYTDPGFKRIGTLRLAGLPAVRRLQHPQW